MRWALEVIDRVEESLVEQRHELFVVIMVRVGSPQVNEPMMFAEGGKLAFGVLFLLLRLVLNRLEGGLAQGFTIEGGQGVVPQDASNLHFSSKNRNYIISFFLLRFHLELPPLFFPSSFFPPTQSFIFQLFKY